MRDAVDLRLLTAGSNWMNIGSLLALGLNGYDSPLPRGSTISVTTGSPGGMCMDGPRLVAEGAYDVAMSTPAWYLAMAHAGTGLFDAPLPLRALAVFPHDDRLVLAVRSELGVTSLSDVKERELPLRISMPTSDMNHPAGHVLDRLLGLHGFSRADVERWGGEILRRPADFNQRESIPAEGSFDAIFDEALMTRRWGWVADAVDLTFLPVEEHARARFAELSVPGAVLAKGRLRGVVEDVPTLDFSGWAMYCHEELDEELGWQIAAALDRRKDQITARFEPEHGLTSAIDMRSAVQDAPIPLHPGAARYYEEKGYL